MSSWIKFRKIISIILIFILSFNMLTMPVKAADFVEKLVSGLSGILASLGNIVDEQLLRPDKITIEGLIRQQGFAKTTTSGSTTVDLADLTTISYTNGENNIIDNFNTKNMTSRTKIKTAFSEVIDKYYTTLLLLSVLIFLVVIIYIGFLMLISTAMEKAKYKQSLVSWTFGLVMLFGFNFIMNFIILANNALASIFLSIVEDTQTTSNVTGYKILDTSEIIAKFNSDADAKQQVGDGNVKALSFDVGGTENFRVKVKKAKGGEVKQITTTLGGGSTSTTYHANIKFTDSADVTIFTRKVGQTAPGYIAYTDSPDSYANKLASSSVYRITTNSNKGFSAWEYTYYAFTTSGSTTPFAYLDEEKSRFVDDSLNNKSLMTIYNCIYQSKPIKDRLVTEVENGYDDLKATFKKELDAQTGESWNKVGIAALYLMSIFLTTRFYVIYIMRTFMVALLTFLFPLVMAIYAIDKARDNRSRVFTTWFNEYSSNVFTNSIHAASYALISYVVFAKTGTPTITGILPVLSTSSGEYKFSPIIRLIGLYMVLPLSKLIKRVMSVEGSGGANSDAGLAGMMAAMSVARGGGRVVSNLAHGGGAAVSGLVGLGRTGYQAIKEKGNGGSGSGALPSGGSSTPSGGSNTTSGSGRWGEARENLAKVGKGLTKGVIGGGANAAGTLMGTAAMLGMGASPGQALSAGSAFGGEINRLVDESSETVGNVSAGAVTGLAAAGAMGVGALRHGTDDEGNQQLSTALDRASGAANIEGISDELKSKMNRQYVTNALLGATGLSMIGATKGGGKGTVVDEQNIARLIDGLDGTTYDKDKVRVIAANDRTLYAVQNRHKVDADGKAQWEVVAIGAGNSSIKAGAAPVVSQHSGVIKDANTGILRLGDMVVDDDYRAEVEKAVMDSPEMKTANEDLYAFENHRETVGGPTNKERLATARTTAATAQVKVKSFESRGIGKQIGAAGITDDDIKDNRTAVASNLVEMGVNVELERNATVKSEYQSAVAASTFTGTLQQYIEQNQGSVATVRSTIEAQLRPQIEEYVQERIDYSDARETITKIEDVYKPLRKRVDTLRNTGASDYIDAARQAGENAVNASAGQTGRIRMRNSRMSRNVNKIEDI